MWLLRTFTLNMMREIKMNNFTLISVSSFPYTYKHYSNTLESVKVTKQCVGLWVLKSPSITHLYCKLAIYLCI